MGDSFLEIQEMCSFSQNVCTCIEVYGILNTRRLTPPRHKEEMSNLLVLCEYKAIKTAFTR